MKLENMEGSMVLLQQIIVVTLSLKRLSDNEIIKEIEKQIRDNKTPITRQTIYNIKQPIKKESYHWYKTLREGQYEYIHEFKERINEILWLQQKHHEIINSNIEPTAITQGSLAELHRLRITLSNLYDVAPSIVNGITLSAPPETKTINTEITV
jgi:hypothetical protein